VPSGGSPGWTEFPGPRSDRSGSRTSTGLLLCVIGFLISWIPVIGGLGGLLGIGGLILVFLGRDDFNDPHPRNVTIGAVLIVVGFLVAVFATVAFAVSIATTVAEPGLTSGELAPQLTSDFQSFMIAILASSLLEGLGQFAMIYSITDGVGRGLMGVGILASFATGVYIYTVVSTEIGGVVQQSVTGGGLNTAPIDALSAQLQNLRLLAAIPALIFAYVYWRTRDDVVQGRTDDLRAPATISGF